MKRLKCFLIRKDCKAAISSDAQNSLNIAVRYLSFLNPLTIHKQGKTAKAYFALAIVCFFWGTTWLASKVARTACSVCTANCRYYDNFLEAHVM